MLSVRHLPFVAMLAVPLILIGCGSGSSDSGGGGASSSSSSTVSSSGSYSSYTGGDQSPFYVPYEANLSSDSSQTGLFVVPSNNLAATPLWLTKGAFSAVTLLYRRSPANETWPAALLYAAPGSDGSWHLYTVDLTDTTTAPAPKQLSSLSLAAITALCGITPLAPNAYDPTTDAIVLRLGATASSGCTSPQTAVVHYGDSASTAPVNLAVIPQIVVYKEDGTLGGFVARDAASSNLYFYADETFTNPVVVAQGVVAAAALRATPGAVFAAAETSAGQFLYRIDASGTPTKVYTAQGTLGFVPTASTPYVAYASTADDHNLYFSDVNSSSQLVMAEPLAGGPATQLYSAGLPGVAYLGSNNSLLIISNGTTVYSLPVDQKVSTPTTIASLGASGEGQAVFAAPQGQLASGRLLVSTAAGSQTSVTYSEKLLTPGGDTLLQVPSAYWAALDPVGYALQISGITDKQGTAGGGSVQIVDLVHNGIGPTFKGGDGNPFVVPAGVRFAVGYLTSTVGSGYLGPNGVAFDQTTGQMATITVANNYITPVF